MTGGTPSTLDGCDARGRAAYAAFVKPKVAEVLRTIALDIVYHRAEGDYVTYRAESGEEVEVLDLLGGYGASLFGHNHPRLVERACALLRGKRPFNAQASLRPLAGCVAERLSERVGRSTGKAYVTTFASTGTEAVEAAIKHAELARRGRIDAIAEAAEHVERLFRVRARDGAAQVTESMLERAGKLLGGPRPKDADELFSRVRAHNTRALDAPPVFLALGRSFHGKSTGALSLTANPEYRDVFRHIGLRTVFLPADDVSRLDLTLDDARIGHLTLRLGDGGALVVAEESFMNVAAAFVEPLQGEGGVRAIDASYLRTLRERADRGRFPLVFDEIQCGMGRTGTFLASEPTGVRGDYYLLSKSLGGGIAKISALLVEREQYDRTFGMLHTSTFAEDDHACGVALAALDLLDEGDGALLAATAAKGARLLTRLEALRAAHPRAIAAVRGRGLMVGIEFQRLDDTPSIFLRVASEQELLGYVIAGYLLHEERIRVMPTLSSPNTIRVQPSAFVDERELDRFAEAIERLAQLLEGTDVGELARFLVGRTGPRRAPKAPPRAPHPPKPSPKPSAAPRRVAFFGHFLDAEDVRDWDPGFADLTDDECTALVERTRRVLHPFVTHTAQLRSALGAAVDLTVIGLPFSSAQVMAGLRSGDTDWVRTMINDGLELARERGAQVVGFGGYTSIVTDNCRDVVDDQFLVTSGNSLTSAAAVEAVLRAGERLGTESLRLGVVGALGNIGAVLAEMLSEHVERIVLVGRRGAQGRLAVRESELYAAALRRWARSGEARGIARTLEKSPLGDLWRSEWVDADDATPDASAAPDTLAAFVASFATTAAREALWSAVERGGDGLASIVRKTLGPAAPILVSTELGALRECNVIVTATNAPKAVIFPEHIGPHPTLLCDVAAPGDVSAEVCSLRDDVHVLKGGMIRLPPGQRLRIRGMPLRDGEIYGCLGETLLLGLAAAKESLSVGALSADNVRRARELALAHGFSFDEKPARPHRR